MKVFPTANSDENPNPVDSENILQEEMSIEETFLVRMPNFLPETGADEDCTGYPSTFEVYFSEFMGSFEEENIAKALVWEL